MNTTTPRTGAFNAADQSATVAALSDLSKAGTTLSGSLAIRRILPEEKAAAVAALERAVERVKALPVNTATGEL